MSIRFDMGFELAIDIDPSTHLKFSANFDGSHDIELIVREDCYHTVELSKADAKVLFEYLKHLVEK